MATMHYREIPGRSFLYWAGLAVCALLTVAGVGAGLYMRAEGHHVTGMNQQIVWGIEHVFAVFLIVAASGALNVASIASVFGRTIYKPLSRLSGLLAIALLIGGLWDLVLDLGRPGHVLDAIIYGNFRSIFAWNMYLYAGFLLITGFYLWFMMERRLNRYSHAMGVTAFLWRLTLTTGTGSIFGFLVSRSAYDTALLAPMFIIMSFAYGLATFLLILIGGFRALARPVGERIRGRLKILLTVFVAAVLYFAVVYNLTNLYMPGQRAFEGFVLLHGGVYTMLFWVGQILIGGVFPLVLLLGKKGASARTLVMASVAVLIGGLAQVYIIIVGAQAYPQQLFPGMIVHSSFYDGVVNPYIPGWPETTLAVSGVGLVGLIVLLAVRVLPFLPLSLADEVTDVHGHDQTVTAAGAAATP
ncbi:MAG: polysulfide reductase NrfD [Gammaproteobacteria bacterium]|nr:polysulfide reductase NrfD [Gammaproteobacteria bacterium]